MTAWRNGELLSLNLKSQSLSKTNYAIIRSGLSGTPLNELEHPETIITAVISRIGVLTGIKEPPTTDLFDFLVKFILSNFKTFTPEEVYKAFELNILGEYPEKVDHYQILGADYFSSVMKHYKNRKVEAYVEYHKLKADKSEEVIPMTDEQSYKGLITYIATNGKLPMAWNWSKVYDYMFAQKLFTENIDQMKEWAKIEKESFLKGINQQLSTCSSVIEKQTLELEKSESSISHHLRKSYIIRFFDEKA